MTIDWPAFTPLSALAGGVLIGIAVALLLLLDGRIAGISGIVGGLLRPARGEVAWRVAFMAGLLIAPGLYALFRALPATRIDADWATLILAGALVGFGTRYGGGCTSGHGVCGLARLSPRSLLATLVFMAAGFATVFVVRHLLALCGDASCKPSLPASPGWCSASGSWSRGWRTRPRCSAFSISLAPGIHRSPS